VPCFEAFFFYFVGKSFKSKKSRKSRIITSHKFLESFERAVEFIVLCQIFENKNNMPGPAIG
jgi:hypothetical protein